MKKYLLIALMIFSIFAAMSFALKFTRDVVDYVEIETALKTDFCRIEKPDCVETTIGGMPADQTAECLRQEISVLECLEETKEIIYGELTIFMKSGGKATETIIILDDEIYDGSTGMFGYYYIDESNLTVDDSYGGYYTGDSGEEFRGLKYEILAHIRRLDSDIEPYGYEWVDPGYVLVYYDEDGTMNMYVDIYRNYYKMSSIKKKVENRKWELPTMPATPAIPAVEVEIPKREEIQTPLPPPPVYLPGMPESADPKKEHVIPNCNSQGASVCRQNETCPDKWILAKEDRCCSVICTPVGKKNVTETDKVNKTVKNETKKNKIEELEEEMPEIETNVTEKNETDILEVVSVCKGNAGCIEGIVTKITDGDTLEVNNTSIRLALINAPEYNETGGNVSTEFVLSICPIGSKAIVDEDDNQTGGSYERTVGVVYCNGKNLNEELVKNGFATIDVRFCEVSEFGNESWAVGC